MRQALTGYRRETGNLSATHGDYDFDVIEIIQPRVRVPAPWHDCTVSLDSYPLAQEVASGQQVGHG
jgi:hypothetical protein